MKSHYRVVVIGGGIVGASVLYHLARKRLGRHRADRARRADGRLHLARRGGLPRHQRRSEHRRAAGVHDQAVPGDRGRERPERRHAHAGRLQHRHDARALGMAAGGVRDLPDARHRSATGDARGDRRRLPDRRSGRAARRPLRPARRRGGPARHDACLCDRCAQARRRRDPAQPRDGPAAARRRQWRVETEQGTVVAEHVVNAGGPVGAPRRTHGGRRPAAHADAAPLPHHRGPAGAAGARRTRCRA